MFFCDQEDIEFKFDQYWVLSLILIYQIIIFGSGKIDKTPEEMQ
jgi:hypothetical protein